MYAVATSAADASFAEGFLLSDGSRVFLDRADERACLLARSHIARFMDAQLIETLVEQRNICYTTRKGACMNDVVTCCKSIHNGTLGPLHGPFWQSLANPNNCDCLRVVQYSVSSIRQIAWEALPTWFGLGTWEDLN